ncbi:HNH endonuclease [Mycobacterium phage Quink]|uniref:Uncharacterized protein n=19 Tax=Viruses TaxID=10239 RepID=Q857W4_9CAUD|nr:gp48 [Mycobacterium phage Cjw1]YP_008051528.1 hypothetical protein PBI_MURPHY_49 [Mycobacterium phage Murphy]YP_008051981.1 hypothetical protein PBI_PHRUX_45 [Mycobacterium phage Phrux]YP_008052223.1 hypothetical protein M039_gp049 [Mycobacterium phage Phaux]YP_008409440.1 hypothetical protein DRDREY_47 [Mycobacterium phage DrDrey]YP_008410062.1 hypothetical protein PBI_CONTAGION_44 [Mycobacterium phage Contagion]YP_008531125.1 HNH endonuclease [Mycobacterium phage Quink]YP_008858778.1 hy
MSDEVRIRQGCACGSAGSEAAGMSHPITDPGDGRKECQRCGKWVFEVIHSCKGVPVTAAAWSRLLDDSEVRREIEKTR